MYAAVTSYHFILQVRKHFIPETCVSYPRWSLSTFELTLLIVARGYNFLRLWTLARSVQNREHDVQVREVWSTEHL